ncbi:hypothetical protein ppKF707_4559 [Metapseudomonas furukawaii]|uniref:Uncharacterized protein n=1 Tax=Metapseudomonas furukawaii TaxID=1149133 RepID=A0AAD1FD79_METFU|nr:hypothetical protein ppKF707_4559 [Pseudomonas furukawaii]BAU72280.1 hypothetical protein KF707C_5920 [Pseudomonas furukawaii]
MGRIHASGLSVVVIECVVICCRMTVVELSTGLLSVVNAAKVENSSSYEAKHAAGRVIRSRCGDAGPVLNRSTAGFARDGAVARGEGPAVGRQR